MLCGAFGDLDLCRVDGFGFGVGELVLRGFCRFLRHLLGA